jgi:hypothetical protein
MVGMGAGGLRGALMDRPIVPPRNAIDTRRRQCCGERRYRDLRVASRRPAFTAVPCALKNARLRSDRSEATMPANRSMKPEEPPAPPEMGRVLRFEPRRKPPGSKAHPHPTLAPRLPSPPVSPSPVEGLEKYSSERDDGDDYGYRMRTNIAAIVLVGILIWCGYWLFNTLAEMRQVQDCILSGRTNCAPISVPIER